MDCRLDWKRLIFHCSLQLVDIRRYGDQGRRAVQFVFTGRASEGAGGVGGVIWNYKLAFVDIMSIVNWMSNLLRAELNNSQATIMVDVKRFGPTKANTKFLTSRRGRVGQGEARYANF